MEATDKKLKKFLTVLSDEVINLAKLKEISWRGVPQSIGNYF